MTCMQEGVYVKPLRLSALVGVLGGAAGCLLGADDPFFLPRHATLGCEGERFGAVVVDCTGSPPYAELTCTFTRLTVTKQDDARSRQNRKEYLEAAARLTPADRERQTADACKAVAAKPAIDFSRVSPEVRLKRSSALQAMQAICDCRGRDASCLTAAMLPTLDAEERTCTVSFHRYQDTFTRVDTNRWVYSESLPHSCVAASTQVLENDAQYSGLWTYTLSELPATTSSVSKTPLCASFRGTNDVCSWRHPAVGMLYCEEVQFE